MAGILTIFSAVFLVLHYVKLDQMIEDKFERMFKQQPTWNLQADGNLPLNCRQLFKFILPGKLCQSLDFFSTANIFTILVEGRSFFEILISSCQKFTFVSE